MTVSNIMPLKKLDLNEASVDKLENNLMIN